MIVNVKRFEVISKALGDPHRIKILKAVKVQAWMQCADIIEIIDLSQPAISHHIKLLIKAGLLLAEKEGRNYKYSLNKNAFEDYIKFLTEVIK